MRCNYYQCELNDKCGYCLRPDYVSIDEKGECNQMLVKKKTITEKYWQLKLASNEAYTRFNGTPTEKTSTAYGIAIEELRDFCAKVVSSMVTEHPEIANKIHWEED